MLQGEKERERQRDRQRKRKRERQRQRERERESFCFVFFSRMYFGEHNIQGMFKVLEPLHQKLEKGPETLKEISFNHVREREREKEG